MKKLIISTVICFFAINANAYAPHPCYNCDRPIPPTTYGNFPNHRSEDQTFKALATTMIAVGVIIILFEMQPSRHNEGQVRLYQF